jgi:hypothetical protein
MTMWALKVSVFGFLVSSTQQLEQAIRLPMCVEPIIKIGQKGRGRSSEGKRREAT